MANHVIDRRTVVASLAGGIVAGNMIPVARRPILDEPTNSRATHRLDSVELNLFDFGVSPVSTAAQNLAGFKRAVATAPHGAVLRLTPSAPLVVRIDTSGGLTAAIEIDKPLLLIIDGDIQATDSAIQINPPYILNVTADNCSISGSGRIIGDGTINDVNTGTDETMPGLIRVAADDFTMTGVEIVRPPKIGVMLYQCHRARIERVRFSGGPRVYGDTGYFAVRAAGGGHHTFYGNRFFPSADRGMFVQCIMLSGSNDNLFEDNHALHPYEKLIYGYGDRNVARNNAVLGNPGFIPGTNIQGTITAVFRFHGSFNRVENNLARNCAGGAQMMDGAAHAVINNRFLSCGQSAITAYHSDLTASTFSGNIGTWAAMAGCPAGDGIRLISDKSAAREVVVERNELAGFSVSDPIATIAAWSSRTAFGRNSVVKPTNGNGRFYAAQTKGVSAGREPAWPTTPGATVSDGTVEWVALAYEGGQAEIKLHGRSAAAPITQSTILNNTTRAGRLGIVTQFLTRSLISGNRINASEWGLVEERGRQNRWRSNKVTGTPNMRVRNLDATSAALSDQ